MRRAGSGRAYHGVVTYTVTLNNTGSIGAASVLLTDTLPAEVDFAALDGDRTARPSPANTITWTGTVSTGQTLYLDVAGDPHRRLR